MTKEQFNALLERIQTKDESALKEIYAAYEKRIMANACRIVGDFGYAEDVANEVLVKIWVNSNQIVKESIKKYGADCPQKRSGEMNPLSKKYKIEWDFFINPNTGKSQFNAKCRRCVHECKQSYRIPTVICPFYEKIR